MINLAEKNSAKSSIREPRVSIIIPTFNRANYLARALESVINQSFEDFEVLVMDDGSSDQTEKVVESFDDARIRYYWSPNSGGPASPRNRGLKIAAGRYVAFLDSDDWWDSNKLAVCVNLLNIGNDFAYHEMRVINVPQPKKSRLMGCRQLKSPVLSDLLISGNPIANSSVVVRRDLLMQTSGLDESASCAGCEDYNLWLQIAQFTEKFIFYPQALGYYLDHEQGISKRDMSIPRKTAIAPFLHVLTPRQRAKVISRLNYTKLREQYLLGDHQHVLCSALPLVKSAAFGLRVRAGIMYLVSFLAYKTNRSCDL